MANHAFREGDANRGAVPTVCETMAIARANNAMNWSQIRLVPLATSVQLEPRPRFSRLCVLINPCPAGLEVHRTWPASALSLWERRSKCLKLEPLRPEMTPGGSAKGETLTGKTLKLCQTPRGARHSVYEPAHTDIHYRTQRQERKQHRRTAVTH